MCAILLLAGSAAAAVLVLTGGDEEDDGQRISGRTEPGARHARLRYLDRDGCIHHVRAGYRPSSGRYALDLPGGARPLTVEAVARQGRVLRETRLGPEGARGPAPADASPVCAPPGMGIACLQPNSIDCDEVGFSVSASAFVTHVHATIAGRRVALRRKRAFEVGRDGRSNFGAVLERAGLRKGPLAVRTDPVTDRWLGEPPVFARVRLAFRFRGGREAVRTFRVRLGAGWG